MPLDGDNTNESVENNDGQGEVVETLTAEQLRAELTKARREAAGRRVNENQLKKDMEDLQKYRDAEKTELELLKERAEKAEAAIAQSARENAARAAAKAAGLDPDLAEFLRGSTDEELKASAEALAERVGSKTDDAARLFAGSRGEPVRPVHDGNAEAFRKLFG